MSWDDLTPREDGGPKGVETNGSPTASRSERGEDGRGRGGMARNPPPPDTPGTAYPMAETARRNEAQRGGGGVEPSQDDYTPNGGGGGINS